MDGMPSLTTSTSELTVRANGLPSNRPLTQRPLEELTNHSRSRVVNAPSGPQHLLSPTSCRPRRDLAPRVRPPSMQKPAWSSPLLARPRAPPAHTRKCPPRRPRASVVRRPPSRARATAGDDATGAVRAGSLADPQPLGSDPEFLPACDTCATTGFVPCKKCDGAGVIKNPRSSNVFFCPDCVGHKKLRCPACGGKCYMCE